MLPHNNTTSHSLYGHAILFLHRPGKLLKRKCLGSCQLLSLFYFQPYSRQLGFEKNKIKKNGVSKLINYSIKTVLVEQPCVTVSVNNWGTI